MNGQVMHRAHKNLDVWQDGMALTTLIYQVTEGFPKSEMFGLSSQMRRAALSIPSNISEGAARNSTKEFLQFLNIAGGSLSELDTQVEIAANLGFLDEIQRHEVEAMTASVGMNLAGLIRHLKGKLK